MIDDVEVKRAKELSPRDIEHDNPEFRRLEETSQLPRADLRPRDRRRGHRDRDPLLPDRRVAARPVRQRRDPVAELTPGAMARVRVPDHLAPDARARARSGMRSRSQSAGRSGGAGRRGRALDRGRRGGVGQLAPLRLALASCPTSSTSRCDHATVERPHLLEGEASGRAGRHRSLAPLRAGRHDRRRLRVERAHHEGVDEPAGPARCARCSPGTTTG